MVSKKPAPRGMVNRTTLIISIVLALALAGGIAFRVVAANQTDIFALTSYGASLQNNQVIVDEARNRTYLGTYQNVILAVDDAGRELWRSQTNGSIEAMCLDTEKDWLLAGSQDRNVYILDAASGTLIRSFAVNGRIYDIDYDQATGTVLVSAGVNTSKHSLYLFDANTGEKINEFKLRYISKGSKFTADHQNIVYGDKRGNLVVLDLAGNEVKSLKARREIIDLEVCPANGDIVATSFDGVCSRYDKDLNLLFAQEKVGEGRSIGISQDGGWIGMGTREGDMYILDGEGNTHYAMRMSTPVTQVYFGTELSYVVTLSNELYAFSTERLNNIRAMDALSGYAEIALIALSVLLVIFLIATFPRARNEVAWIGKVVLRNRVAYIMLIPSFALILIFHYYPVIQAFVYSFSDWNMSTRTMREVNFIGFSNYVKMFREGYFVLGVKNMLLIIITSMIKLLTIPILCAELVFAMKGRTGDKRKYWFRLLLVVPMVVPGVVSTLMWKNIYDPNIGLLNEIMKLFGMPTRSWLGSEETALWSIIGMGFPWVHSFAFLVFYGGLINIPGDLFEAARVDGSNPRWNFFHIHLPLIGSQIKMMVILTFISAIQDYGGILLLTQGGPGTATYVPGYELYLNATALGQYGYACAMGVVLFIVILIGSIFNMKARTEEALG